MDQPTNIFCNASLSPDAMKHLSDDLSPHRVIFSATAQSNLSAGEADPLMAQATVAFGQPDPQQVIDLPQIKWVHLTSAGYTRYDTDAFRAAMRARNGILTNSSAVYSDPCAEHAFAMMMALARQLPQCLDDQRRDRRWASGPLRANSHLLRGQSILIYGFGAIAKRLVELLRPFGMQITGVRRFAKGDEGIAMVSAGQADQLLGRTDHVMNILPASPETDHFFDARRLARFSPSAFFYNIGRGSTVDQDALQFALQQNHLAGAYLDVTTPEPLPVDHLLWSLPNCWITPHTAGGHHDEPIRLVKHFRENLRRYQMQIDLLDRII